MHNLSFSKIWIMVILIILTVGGIFAWQKGWSPIKNASWQIYTNTQYGFKIEYPKNWEAEITQTGTIKINNLETNSYFEIIENQNPEKLSLDDWFREATIIGGRPTIKASAQTVTINGIKAYRLDSNLQPPNSLFEIVGIANAEERIFSIYAHSGKTNDNNILNKILSSFKFIDETLDWTTYANEQYGYEFKYPENINISYEGETGFELQPLTIAFHSAFQITVWDNPNRLNIKEYLLQDSACILEQGICAYLKQGYPLEDFKVGSEWGWTTNPGILKPSHFFVSILTPDKRYSILEFFNLWSDDTEKTRVFNKVLSTFRFLE